MRLGLADFSSQANAACAASLAAFDEVHLSYDFELFRADRGRPAREDDFEAGERDPAKEAAKRKVADLLRAHDARLEETEFAYDEVARLHRIKVDEAYRRLRHIELSDVSAGGSGAQISLFDESAALSLPFWHEGDAARRNLERVWGYFDVICNACGYEVFDVQLDCVIARSRFADVLLSYENAMRRMSGRPALRRPWWKFWGAR